jgi:hypothetical protein
MAGKVASPNEAVVGPKPGYGFEIRFRNLSATSRAPSVSAWGRMIANSSPTKTSGNVYSAQLGF